MSTLINPGSTVTRAVGMYGRLLGTFAKFHGLCSQSKYIGGIEIGPLADSGAQGIAMTKIVTRETVRMANSKIVTKDGSLRHAPTKRPFDKSRVAEVASKSLPVPPKNK